VSIYPCPSSVWTLRSRKASRVDPAMTVCSDERWDLGIYSIRPHKVLIFLIRRIRLRSRKLLELGYWDLACRFLSFWSSASWIYQGATETRVENWDFRFRFRSHIRTASLSRKYVMRAHTISMLEKNLNWYVLVLSISIDSRFAACISLFPFGPFSW